MSSVPELQQHSCPWCNRLQLSAAKETVDSLRAMTGDMVSSSDLADLTRSAEAVEERSRELASKQGETLQQVAEELLCSPEIIRQVLSSCSLSTPHRRKEKATKSPPCPMLLASTPIKRKERESKEKCYQYVNTHQHPFAK